MTLLEKEFTIDVEPDVWATIDQTVGPHYGKVRYANLPIQSLNPLQYKHKKLYTEETVIGLLKAAYYDGYTDRGKEARANQPPMPTMDPLDQVMLTRNA